MAIRGNILSFSFSKVLFFFCFFLTVASLPPPPPPCPCHCPVMTKPVFKQCSALRRGSLNQAKITWDARGSSPSQRPLLSKNVSLFIISSLQLLPFAKANAGTRGSYLTSSDGFESLIVFGAFSDDQQTFLQFSIFCVLMSVLPQT